MKITIKLLILAALVGCTNQAPVTAPSNEPPKTEPPKPLKADWAKPEYTAFVVKALDDLGSNLMTGPVNDAKNWCGDFGKADRKQFWVMVFSSLARYESDFKPEVKYTESFKDQKGNFIISRGLLQLSLESSKGYDCGFKDEQELHDPEKNIRCGVRILNKWVSRDFVVSGGSEGAWKGGARYWSPFRNATKLKAMQAKVKAVCP